MRLRNTYSTSLIWFAVAVFISLVILLCHGCSKESDNEMGEDTVSKKLSWSRGLACQKVMIGGKGYIVCTAYTYGGRSAAVCKE